MRSLRTTGLIGLGVLLGAGATAGITLRAQPQPSARLVAGEQLWVGNAAVRYFRDTKTNVCYLAGFDNGSMTALTEAPWVACEK
jgi:hypothetical protein